MIGEIIRDLYNRSGEDFDKRYHNRTSFNFDGYSLNKINLEKIDESNKKPRVLNIKNKNNHHLEFDVTADGKESLLEIYLYQDEVRDITRTLVETQKTSRGDKYKSFIRRVIKRLSKANFSRGYEGSVIIPISKKDSAHVARVIHKLYETNNIDILNQHPSSSRSQWKSKWT
ncbi:hypothetical protein JW851_01965 [Candidatus Woesearchaeota archaeon]|nr:hypothetical protein [Candidatus Woesearchaeota archaeon]